MLLTIVFGPLGLFYASALAALLLIGAVIALVVLASASVRADPFSLLLVSGFLSLPILAILWVLSIIIGTSIASTKHRRFEVWKVRAMAAGVYRPW